MIDNKGGGKGAAVKKRTMGGQNVKFGREHISLKVSDFIFAKGTFWFLFFAKSEMMCFLNYVEYTFSQPFPKSLNEFFFDTTLMGSGSICSIFIPYGGKEGRGVCRRWGNQRDYTNYQGNISGGMFLQ